MSESKCSFQDIVDHYLSRRAIAQAYLCAIASKALTINALQCVSPQKCIEDLQHEANVKFDIKRNDELRLFAMKLQSVEGFTVMKRDRLLRTRTINLRLAINRRGECLYWVSKRGWSTKLFTLATLRSVEEVIIEGDDKRHQCIQVCIRLQNARRRLDLLFEESWSHKTCFSYFKSRFPPEEAC